jgi:hypothetical protein
MTLPAHRVALFLPAAIPFVLLPAALAWSVGPIARTGARWCQVACDVLAFRTADTEVAPLEESGAVVSAEAPADGHAHSDHPSFAPSTGGIRTPSHRPSEATTARPTAAKRPIARRASPNVFVGPESIQRAIPVAGRPTSAWTNRTPEHPAGILIQSPGALRGVIEPGDILVEAEGQPIGNFEQLVVTVRQAYERRATRLSGRLFRRGDLVPVTVEPGW